MQRTYRVPLARAGLVGLAAIAILLAHPGTSIAGGASEATSGGNVTLLQRGAGYDADGKRASVRALQRTLRKLGWGAGRVDGLYGPQTEAAVKGVQSAGGLAVDGIVGPQTRRTLRALRSGTLRRGAGYATPTGSKRVRRLQSQLRRRGFNTGPVDGRFGPQTERAVARLQHAAGLPAQGAVDHETRRVLARAGGEPARTRPADTGRSPDGPRAVRSSAAPHAVAGQPDGLALGAVLVGAALVLLTGAVAGLFLGRIGRFRRGVAVPVAHGVVAEGEAPSVGRFRGRVEALVLDKGRLRRAAEAHYLVSSPGKGRPFWVRHSDVERLRPPRERKPEPKPKPQPSPPEPRVVASPDGVRALGYVSVPAQAAEEETRQLRELGAVVDSYCDARGWRLVEVVHDKDNGNGKALERPGMHYALDRMARGDAARLVVPRLDVLSRSVPDLGRVIEAVRRTGGSLIVLDIGLDTASSHGELAAETVASIGEWERRRLAERTRKGLAAAKARGAVTGRPAVQDFPGLQERIAAMRSNGMTLQAIAERLNAEGVPTIRGGAEWRPSSVQAATGYRRPRKPEGGVQ